MNIAVVGTGYVGLVTGTCLSETGNNVICIDIDADKVAKLQGGQITIYEPGLEVLFQRNIKEGRLHFTTNLEEAIQNFGGCVMVSSHDRWFLDRTATHILAFEGDSRVVWFEGNYKMYEIQRHERLGDEADQPHRIKYRPLART